MRSLLRSELIKLTTTRTFYGLLAGTIVVVLLGTFSTITSADARELVGPLYRHPYYLLTSVNAGLFGLVLGIRSVTDEFRHGTIVPTLLARGGRVRSFLAKVLIAMTGGAVIGVAAQIAMASSALMMSASRDAALTVSGSWAPMAGMTLAITGWAALGAGLGAIVRRQVAGIAGGLIWVLAIENIGSGFLKESARFLPGLAAHGLAQARWVIPTLSQANAAVVFTGYIVLLCTIGALLLTRRDVT